MTTKQRAHLRSLANGIEPILHIGKDGISDNLVKQAWDALEARELVKATVLRAAPYDSAREACDALCEKVHAEPVQVIGNKFVMYRMSRKPRIEL
jgi:RNA-binding protein